MHTGSHVQPLTKAMAAAINASAMPRRKLELPNTSGMALESRHTMCVRSMWEVVVETRVELWHSRPISTRPHVSLRVGIVGRGAMMSCHGVLMS